MNARKGATILASFAVLAAAGAKVWSGDVGNVNSTEVLLAISTLSAAFGFQSKQ